MNNPHMNKPNPCTHPFHSRMAAFMRLSLSTLHAQPFLLRSSSFEGQAALRATRPEFPSFGVSVLRNTDLSTPLRPPCPPVQYPAIAPNQAPSKSKSGSKRAPGARIQETAEKNQWLPLYSLPAAPLRAPQMPLPPSLSELRRTGRPLRYALTALRSALTPSRSALRPTIHVWLRSCGYPFEPRTPSL
jgi:hypothetical protein